MNARLYDERLGEALRWMAELFALKSRKGGCGAPYLSHLLAVTALVLEHGGTEDEAIAAVLHDVLEDVEGAEASHIEARFGVEVAAMVLALSDTLQPDHKEPWQGRKERHLLRLRTASPGVKRIALADKVHNAGTLLEDLSARGLEAFSHFKGGASGTCWYYRAALEVLGDAPAPLLLARLEDLVQRLDAHCA
jgi:(p)ppGpp synthase/HD superfamily hydrolase